MGLVRRIVWATRWHRATISASPPQTRHAHTSPNLARMFGHHPLDGLSSENITLSNSMISMSRILISVVHIKPAMVVVR